MAKAVKVTKAQLQAEVAAVLVSEGATAPPVDFKDLDNPLRIEIEMLLAKVAVGTTKDQLKKAKCKERNLDRAATVEAYIVENYPGNKRLLRIIMGDLSSYVRWENESGKDEEDA